MAKMNDKVNEIENIWKFNKISKNEQQSRNEWKYLMKKWTKIFYEKMNENIIGKNEWKYFMKKWTKIF